MELDPRSLGIPAHSTSPGDLPTEDSPWRAEFVAAVLCGGFAFAASAASKSEPAVPLFLLSYLAGSWFAAREVWKLLSLLKLDVHFLMLLVAVGSASIGGWGEGAILLFLFSFSGALERYALGRTEREIRSLLHTSPKTARVLRDGSEEMLPIEEVLPGMRLLIKPGDLVPVDCELQVGNTACDESTLTGESAPVDKSFGSTLFAGTLNLWGAVQATVLKPASESALHRIIEMIREAQHLKAPAQQFTDRFGCWYTTAILALSCAMFFVWWIGYGLPPFKGDPQPSAFYRTMTLLVVASPCALVLSIPSAILSAIAFAARRGILFRGGSAVERLAETTVVVMDKTGTITTGELSVEKVESFPASREAEIAALAFSLESLSTHPLARAITGYGRQHGIAPVPLSNFESVPGVGLRALAHGAAVRLGKREWVLDGINPVEPPDSDFALSEVWVRKENLVGRIVLRDEFRQSARKVVEALHALKLRTVLLTGDRSETAELARTLVGVQEVKGGLKPDEKLRVIGALKRHGERVAMIGDGVNDAPSLAAADVGVAMGARGSDAALEQADVVLMHDKLENFLLALNLSHRARRIIRQNLFISLGTVLVLVAAALGRGIPLTAGVIGHEGSTVIVVLNSLRLLLGGNAPPSSSKPRRPPEDF
jgi:Zn2+/Cd2+-exporting ATPase